MKEKTDNVDKNIVGLFLTILTKKNEKPHYFIIKILTL